MQPKYQKVPLLHFPLPKGSPPIVTGYHFRPIVPVETAGGPEVSGMLERMLESDQGDQGDQGDGGSKVPLVAAPKSPTPLAGVAKPLPKVLRA
jgi:hypothetical protein